MNEGMNLILGYIFQLDFYFHLTELSEFVNTKKCDLDSPKCEKYIFRQ